MLPLCEPNTAVNGTVARYASGERRYDRFPRFLNMGRHIAGNLLRPGWAATKSASDFQTGLNQREGSAPASPSVRSQRSKVTCTWLPLAAVPGMALIALAASSLHAKRAAAIQPTQS